MRRFVAAVAMLGIGAAPAAAQDGLLESCAAAPLNVRAGQNPPPAAAMPMIDEQFEFLCAQVVNALANVQPSVGIAFSGGNPVLGTATTLGKRVGILPRVSVSARVNLALADMPELFDEYAAEISEAAPELAVAQTKGIPIGSVQGDIALGLFNGISVGPTLGGIGAIDLLGSVSMVPKVAEVGLTDAITNIGVGARVGILRQGLLVPGISVSAMYRQMDEITFGDLAAGDPGQFSTDLRTLSLRAIVSKGILAFDLAVGAGYDRYTSDIALGWQIHCETDDCVAAEPSGIDIDGDIAGELSTAAWNVFGNVALDLLVLNLVGEVGYQKAVDPIDADALRNAGLPDGPLTVDALNGGRFFGSVGLRLSL
ncbi:MAG TPA: hypothetical protein VF158_09200 [Longimicrobiales bacterium]